MLGGLVFPSLSEFSTVDCDPHNQRLGIVKKAEIDAFLELSGFFNDAVDVGNLILGSSVISNFFNHFPLFYELFPFLKILLVEAIIILGYVLLLTQIFNDKFFKVIFIF